ncbi:hypothetical protein HDU76_013439 [Blyttiomyces sp. JEL0837]|nr:hypothetical protein HDU76_013439 [Blyttiomyces sp. JEL0837]
MPVNKPKSQYEEFFTWAKGYSKKLPSNTKSYFKELFPIADWLPRYNVQWLVGDLIAGITVGMVVIPQAIAYATKLANLPAQYGLYTSFFGVLIYALFATSKDVTIGPTAVLSLLVGQTIASYDGNDTPGGKITFAITLSFFTGLIQLILGLFRLGLIVDFVPIPVITGFTTGAGVQIIIQQLPTLCGIKGIDTNAAAYQVLGNWLKALNNLPNSKWDVTFGVSALAFILLVKYGAQFGAKKYAWIKYVGLARNGFAVILFTLISYGTRGTLKPSPATVGYVPPGFSGIQGPSLGDAGYIASVLKALPGILIVSVLEHVAVTKSYGRLNGYKPQDNQELVAIGVTNLVGSFLGAYPATGSFSRSAIKSASGVRSPMAAFYTAIIVLISLFALTNTFYWIPNAVLSAIIIGAITELFVGARIIKKLFDTQFVDFIGFWIALIVTFFANIETAIYASVAFSVVVLLVRIARPKVRVLTRTAQAGWIDAEGEGYTAVDSSFTPSPEGILVFRPYESLTYPNASYLFNTLKDITIERFSYSGAVVPNGDRIWSDTTREKSLAAANGIERPHLRAVVLDFSAVNQIDYTGLQTLLDVKEDLERFAGGRIPFHFAHVRQHQLRILWDLPTLGSATVDATPGERDEDGVGTSSTITRTSLSNAAVAPGIASLRSRSDEVDLHGKYFHLSVDEAVAAADAETSASRVSLENGNAGGVNGKKKVVGGETVEVVVATATPGNEERFLVSDASVVTVDGGESPAASK